MSATVQDKRGEARFEVIIPATCRSRTGFRDRAFIYDLSSYGCRIRSNSLSVMEGDMLVVRPEGVEGLCGEVRWVRGRDAGVRFTAPLYGPVVDHLYRTWKSFQAVSLEQGETVQRRVA